MSHRAAIGMARLNPLRKNWSPSSEFDRYLNLPKLKYVLQEGAPIKIKLGWGQQAPEGWSIYALYLDNSQEIYLVFPNGNVVATQVRPGKNFTFPGRRKWGVEINAGVPDDADSDNDRIIILLTSQPLKFFEQKTAKLPKGGIASLQWSEMGQLANELSGCKWSSGLVDIWIKK